MEIPSLEEENIVKDERNPFTLKKLKEETTDTTIETIKMHVRLEKNEAIKDRILRDIRYLFDNEEEYYYKPVKVSNHCSKSFIE